MKKLGTSARAVWGVLRNRYVSFAFRFALGTTFIVSGAGKLPERAEFVRQCQQYDLLPDVLARLYGTGLPWVEIVVGSFLLLGLFSRFAAGIGMLTALSCIIANSILLYRGLNLECRCFGELAVIQTRDALLIDFALLIMAFQVLVHRGEFLSLDSIIFRRKSSEAASD
ncbi:MAG: DoxX family membrane protein [Dehalococcoidia bacterium]|nr:MAG: DoxX family membrane protein [Dehalococcoidia bacterium]